MKIWTNVLGSPSLIRGFVSPFIRHRAYLARWMACLIPTRRMRGNLGGKRTTTTAFPFENKFRGRGLAFKWLVVVSCGPPFLCFSSVHGGFPSRDGSVRTGRVGPLLPINERWHGERASVACFDRALHARLPPPTWPPAPPTPEKKLPWGSVDPPRVKSRVYERGRIVVWRSTFSASHVSRSSWPWPWTWTRGSRR